MKSSMTKLAAATVAMVAVVVGGAEAAPLGLFPAAGEPVTTTFSVSASVASGCVIGNSTTMNFGGLQMLSSATGGLSPDSDFASAMFDATCTNGTALPALKFTSQNGGGSAFGMMGGVNSDVIGYSLYAGTVEGAAIAHDTSAAFAGFDADGTVKNLRVVGVITSSDKAGKTIGSYADTVTITASFTPD